MDRLVEKIQGLVEPHKLIYIKFVDFIIRLYILYYHLQKYFSIFFQW